MEKSMNMEKWKQVRAKGKARFIWMNGFLFWGVSTAVLWSTLMQLFQPQEPIWVRPLVAIIVFPVGGLIWSNWLWYFSERKYRKKA